MSIIETIKDADLSAGKFIVVASGTLDALGIRPADDIDLVISEEYFQQLKESGWKEVSYNTTYKVLIHGLFEASLTWNEPNDRPNLQALLTDATYIQGIPFANLDSVKAWKTKLARQKDIADLKLIEDYEAQQAK